MDELQIQNLETSEQGGQLHSEVSEVIEDITPSVGSEQVENQEIQEPEERVFEIEGQKFTESELKEILQKAKNYEHLLPEFTRRSQELAELKKLKEQLTSSQSPEQKVEEEVIKYLRENLGLVTKKDLQDFFVEFGKALQTYIEEEEKLRRAIETLSKKYDGTNAPKFDYEKLREHLIKKYGEDRANWPDYIDLEYEYFDMNREFFSKVPELKKKTVPSERGIPSATITTESLEEKPLHERIQEFLQNY